MCYQASKADRNIGCMSRLGVDLRTQLMADRHALAVAMRPLRVLALDFDSGIEATTPHKEKLYSTTGGISNIQSRWHV